ncbi:MAG: cell division protein FtsH [Candidatus Liptonbacteria bacterium RIFCSPHIGHO2_01_FULL_57_28]|uniref:ATP-dependent zinc metalloprotease FtsH n=1 Tax=Candidatus Liptonbacteria bacterium RIFCSPHIGHO2_01_FULL_57_28 TaxID=1798647 RepID=A0A1G2CAJ2_9BACT|nr:MAG: cell division protein FtsH [Candidatus Liptonbacteria bacterium RIFCSPHIGHO2_01_FULL_57_28]
MKNIYKNFLWAVVTLLSISILFSLFAVPAVPPKDFTLSELASQISKGEVKEINVSGEQLDITLKDGSKAVAQKEDLIGITETLANLGVEPKALQAVQLKVVEESGWQFWAGLIIPTLLPVIVILFIFWFMLRQAKGGVNQAFSFGRSGIKLSGGPGKQKFTFADVAGLKEAKEELVEVVDFLKNPKKYLDLGAKIPRGVLLVGPPGTGKTLLARATSGEAGVPFFHISASEFVEMFVGVGASRTRDAFQTAKKAAPAILFVDEIDAVGRQRGAGLGGGNDEREQTLNQILVEMDGFERDTQLIVLAATNRPDVLDPALLRPGRFDRHVILDAPDINDREAILKIHSKDVPLAKDVDLRKIAVRTPGFVGADLANVLNEGALLAARRNQKAVTQTDLYNALEKVILGPERRSRAITAHERELTAYHEGGHALVAASLKDADPVHKISIVARGMAGGYTMKLPIEERRLRTRDQFMSDLAVAMGGFVAEKLVFGDVSTGASNDLKTASSIARQLVTKYGMSGLGPITFGKSEELLFLGREIATEKDYSEDTAKKIDYEVHGFIERAHDLARRILTTNKKALKAIADKLMEKETLEQEDFNAVLKPFKIKALGV